MYLEARTRFGNKVLLETRQQQGTKDCVFIVTKPKTEEKLQEEEQKRHLEEEEELQTCVGFAHVLRHIVQAVIFYVINK